MRISRIHIENFRSLRQFDFQPSQHVNLIVGENNAGKSALLVALARTLGRATPEFDFDDFYTATTSMDVTALPIICIDIEIVPTTASSCSTHFSTEFVEEIRVDPSGSQSLLFRTQARYEPTQERVLTEYFTIRADWSARPMSSNKRFVLRGYLPFYLVDAFRDTIRDIQGRRGFWGRIVNSITIDSTTAASIQNSVESINKAILGAAPRIADIESRLREIGSTIPTATPPNDIVVTPITVDPSGILRNLDVMLQTDSAPRGFPIARHGEGTRSVAHLAIFRAFVDLLAQDENDNLEAMPILGIEEPEVHLHPHAIRALGQIVTTPPRQVFLTTHSPALAGTVGLASTYLLKRSASGTQLRAVPEFVGGHPFLDQREQIKLDYALRHGAVDILFSGAAILCEGASEVQAYPYFASALGIDMNRLGISLVPVEGSDFFCLMRVMADDALEIPWVVSADGDKLEDLAQQLVKLGKVTLTEKQQAEALSKLRSMILEPSDLYTLPNGHDLEEELIRGGAAREYDAAISLHAGPTALSNFLRNTGSNLSALEDQLVDFMNARSKTGGRRWKVLLQAL